MRVWSAPSLREQVAAKLRDAIASGRFKSGERLVERELCELMGVSRTSVREAFRELETEGLITTVPNRGPIVTVVTPGLAESIFQVRGILEALAARLFAERASDEQIAALERAADDLAEVYLDYDPERVPGAKAAFYGILLEGADNEVCTWMLKNIHIRVSQLRVTSLDRPQRARESLDEMREIFAAIKARDPRRAHDLSLLHVDRAAAAALAVLRRRASEGGRPV